MLCSKAYFYYYLISIVLSLSLSKLFYTLSLYNLLFIFCLNFFISSHFLSYPLSFLKTLNSLSTFLIHLLSNFFIHLLSLKFFFFTFSILNSLIHYPSKLDLLNTTNAPTTLSREPVNYCKSSCVQTYIEWN